MQIFYNKDVLGETLIIRIKEAEKVTYEMQKNTALIYDEKKHLVGLNIFNVENLNLEGKGIINLNEGQKEILESRLKKINIKLDFDSTNDENFVVGEVLTKEKHPNADKLSLTTVKVGKDEILQIVCGAKNVAVGQRVVVAKIGAIMPSGLLIKKSKLRGIESFGMLCSKKELAIEQKQEEKGILVLDEKEEVGKKFSEITL